MPPVIIKPLKDSDAAERIPLEISCEISGTPKPEVNWYILRISKIELLKFIVENNISKGI